MSFFIPTAAIGNGLSLATFGRAGEIMGFFYPRLDFAQNVREGMPAVRLIPGTHGVFRWCFEECWRVAQSLQQGNNVLITRLAHRELELAIEIADVLPPREQALVRRVVVTRGPQVPPTQFLHYFRLCVGDEDTRNEVHVHNTQNVVVQQHRDVALALTATEPFAGQCSSLKPGTESLAKAAMRAGQVGAYPQAIGRVDFAIAFEPMAGSRWQTTMVLAGGTSAEMAIAASKRVAADGFEVAARQAGSRAAEILSEAAPCPLYELTDAYERALISLHDLYDESEGTFIAAPEFDPGYELSGGYGYCWPRDAAVCALAMQQIGRADLARRFFEWAARTQLPSGHWYQRYWTDGSAAPSWCVSDHEIQLDQTCATLHAAGLFARRLAETGGPAAAFVQAFGPAAERGTQAILEHINADGLHRTASDLWENAVGSFAYTQAAVWAALREADEVFGIDPARTGPASRAVLREQLITTFWDPERRHWLRRITPEGKPDPTMDSSAMGVILPWGVLDPTDAADRQLAIDTLESISRDLRSSVKGGGAILRFAGESYMGGGPGCVNTLWLALCWLRLASTAADPAERCEQRARALYEIRIALANTSPTGQLPELIPKVKFDYWAAPHGWACALLIEAIASLRTLGPPGTSAFDAQRAQVRRRAPSP